MTVRHAYFPPGEEDPEQIFDSLDSLMGYAKARGDKAPMTMPVTLGPVETPEADHILNDIVYRLCHDNPAWETGWERFEHRFRRDLHLQVARLAASIRTWAEKNHGYVVDIRNVAGIEARTGQTIHTGDIHEEEE